VRNLIWVSLLQPILNFSITLIRQHINHQELLGILSYTYSTYPCLLYTSLVRPTLDYVCAVWQPYLLKVIRTLQRRTTRLLPNLTHLVLGHYFKKRYIFLTATVMKSAKVTYYFILKVTNITYVLLILLIV